MTTAVDHHQIDVYTTLYLKILEQRATMVALLLASQEFILYTNIELVEALINSTTTKLSIALVDYPTIQRTIHDSKAVKNTKILNTWIDIG